MAQSAGRRLYRSRRDRLLCGVCGGLAEYFNADPVLVRLGAVVLFVLNPGAVLLIYIAACIVIPEQPEQTPAGEPRPGAEAFRGFEGFREAGRAVLLALGVALIVVGALSALGSLLHPRLAELVLHLVDALKASVGIAAGVAMILLGVLLLVAASKK